jgi:dolichol-phosphate mannosyltransferase
MHSTPPIISLVIPFLNEEAVLPKLFLRLSEELARIPGYHWELILVDDGSTDGSHQAIRRHRSSFPGTVRLVQLARNFGHQPAVMAGLRACRGDASIILDADLQDPPSVFPAFLEKFREGFEVVYAVRQNRKESLWKRVAYGSFYRIFRRFADVEVPLDAGDFGLISRAVRDQIITMPERDVLVRGLRTWVGFRQTGVPYDRPERDAGETKYTLAKLIRLAAAGFFGYSTLPLRLATWLGLLAAASALVYGLYVIVTKLGGQPPPPGWASLALLVVFFGGIQLICIGIVGEYIGRIYQQVQGRPLYVVARETEL